MGSPATSARSTIGTQLSGLVQSRERIDPHGVLLRHINPRQADAGARGRVRGALGNGVPGIRVSRSRRPGPDWPAVSDLRRARVKARISRGCLLQAGTELWAWACSKMGAHTGARSARTCSRPLPLARPGTALTWAGTHSC